MKRISILIFAICLGNLLTAQQLPQLTQYTNNSYAVNPAIAGMYDYYQVNTTIRNQWTGINDAPRTSIISIYGKHNKNVGLGGMFYNDVTGHTSRVGAAASYTYSFRLSANINLALALQGGFTQFKIMKDLQTQHPDDPKLLGGNIIRTLPDATFGFNLSGKNWYIGAAIPQLLSVNLDLMDDDFAKIYNTVSQNGKLTNHLYILGAYIYEVNPMISIEPSLFIKSVSGAKTQLDFGVKSEYKKLFWLGMNYKMNNELSPVAALLGYNINKRFSIGYSYGIPSGSTILHSGSHEFMLGVNFAK